MNETKRNRSGQRILKGSSTSSKGKRGNQCTSVPLQTDRNGRAIFQCNRRYHRPKVIVFNFGNGKFNRS